MKMITAEKILKILGLEKTSDNFQTLYKVEDLILYDANDYFIKEKAKKRGLFPKERCSKCGKGLEDTYSDNGVWDQTRCYNRQCSEGRKP